MENMCYTFVHFFIDFIIILSMTNNIADCELNENYYTQQIDENYHPCDDVYNFVCKKFVKSYDNGFEHFQKEKNLFLTIGNMIESIDVHDKKIDNYKKSLSNYFRSCLSMKNGNIDEKIGQIFQGLTKRVGFPSFIKNANESAEIFSNRTIWYLLGIAEREMATSTFFKVIIPDKGQDQCHKAIKVLQLKLEKPQIGKINETKIKNFADIYTRNSTLKFSQRLLSESVQQMFEFESELKNLTDAIFDAESTRNFTFLDSLSVNLSEKIVLDDYFEGLFSNKQLKIWKAKKPYWFKDDDKQMQLFNKLLNKYDKKLILDYIFVNYVTTNYEYVYEYSKLGRNDPDNLKLYCMQTFTFLFTPALTSIFFDHQKWNITDWRSDIDIIAASIITVMNETINRANFLDKTDRKTITGKLASIKFYSGLPSWLSSKTMLAERTGEYDTDLDYYQNIYKYSFDRSINSIFENDSHKPEPEPEFRDFTSVCDKSISFGLPLILPPVYDITYPLSVKYGYLGWSIARALLGNFMKSSSLFKPSTAEWLKKQRNCLESQLKPHCAEVFGNCYFDEYQTTSKLIDIDATKITYEAYKIATGTRERNLTNHSNVTTDDEMFFIANAHTICRYHLSERSSILGPEEKNANLTRTAVTMTNNKIFSKVFHCSFTSNQLCGIWN